MLLLGRREGQAIRIYPPGMATPVVVYVTKSRRRGVQLGIEADKSVRIVREELEAEPKEAA